MFAKYIIIVFHVIVFQNVGVCQVCVETRMTWQNAPETYLYTYLEAYEKTNCLFWCTDTRVATAVGTRTVKKKVAEQINVCCDGYVEDKSIAGNSIHCKPVCNPFCINGYCKSPDVCACSPGYLPDVLESHRCIPLCLKGCEHGTCNAPNTCDCDEGYQLIDDVCKPICLEPCDNGTCVAPETCQCNPGYKKSDNGICEPYCSSYTASGECINTITCEPGWAKVIKGSIEVCQPVCLEPCVNGTCIAPEVCECYNGYVKSSLNTCEPYCSSGCSHGSCIGPETCVCEPGWFKKESGGICLPHCDRACGNGTCVAPNVCECFPGYRFDESKLLNEEVRSLCVPICDDCEGTCLAPGECGCMWPQIPLQVTANGDPCDCYDDCSNTEYKCEKTICAMTTTTTTTETVEQDIEQIFSTPAFVEYDNSVEGENDYLELNIEKASWFHSKWLYGVGAVLLTSALILSLAAVLKRKCGMCFVRNLFSSQSDEVSSAVHYKKTCSS